MSLQEDRIIDQINKPLLGAAAATTVAGFFMCLTIVLLPVGLPLLFVGGVWALVLYGATAHRVKHAVKGQPIQQ